MGAGFERALGTVTQFRDSTGPKACVGGEFTEVNGTQCTSGGQLVGCLAAWNGTICTSLGAGISRPVVAAAGVDNGVTTELRASFATTGWGAVPNGVARWDCSSWRVQRNNLDMATTLAAAHVFGARRAIVASARRTLHSTYCGEVD